MIEDYLQVQERKIIRDSTLVAEAQAIKEGVLLATNQQIDKAISESDCLEAVKMEKSPLGRSKQQYKKRRASYQTIHV